ncbi:MAG TPA: hypothetical protein VMG82_20840, partial [Candidatus Sulfotelmatobacter sp.]|nr:hypothetical protein [Candidatus Sulfotelmatobacter sp.]
APPPDNAAFDETAEIDLPYNAWVPPKTERQIMEEKHRIQKLHEWQAQQAQIRANLERARIPMHQPTQHAATSASPVQAQPKPSQSAGADAPCPERSRRVRPGREATVPAAETTSSPQPPPPPTTVPPHNFKQTPQSTPNPAPSRTPARKPPQPTRPVPKQRRNKAHSLP